MADYTKYKRLELPKTVEKYDVGVANKNNQVIDSELNKLDLKNQSQDELLATKESLNSEITRAITKENDIIEDLNFEIARAKSAENSNADSITNETARAITAEEEIVTFLQDHISNKVNTSDIINDIDMIQSNTISGKVADALVIKQVFQSVSNGKQLVASAITDKGVSTEATDTFVTMAENIKSIPSNGTGEIESPLICRFYYNMSIDLNSTQFRFYFPIKKVKKLIIKNLYFTVSKQREANNRNFYLQIYGKNDSGIFKIKEFVGIADFIGIKTIINLEDTEIDINGFDSVEYFDIYSPSVTLNYLYDLNLDNCIFELYT